MMPIYRGRTWLAANAISLMLMSVCFAQSPETRGHDAEVAKAAAADMDAGHRGYETHCRACHQGDGSGLAGAFPPLAGNPRLQEGGARHVLEVVLGGQSGPLEVFGVTYDGVMPPMGYLSDQEVADIVTYVLNAWGTTAGS